MAQGHISVVIGVQSSLKIYGDLLSGSKPQENLSQTSEHYTYTQLKGIQKYFLELMEQAQKNGITISWSLLGGEYETELAYFFNAIEAKAEKKNFLRLEEVQNKKLDAMLYVPFDLTASRQIEQMARLAIIHPKIRHVAMAQEVSWTDGALLALKESWDWVNPFKNSELNIFSQEIMALKKGSWEEFSIEIEDELPTGPALITRNQQMKELLKLIDTVSDSDGAVLISGPSGCGKEILAQRIHAQSMQKQGSWVKVMCSTLRRENVEEDLLHSVQGKFVQAQGGTLFLDEIDSLDESIQVMIFQVLQNGFFSTSDSKLEQKIDFRIIASSQTDLEKQVQEGKFREDLFYKVSIIPFQVLSLKERLQDIPLLVEYFLNKFNLEKRRRVTGLTRSAHRALAAYDWPGNVRELENLMERMVILKAAGMIDALDFPEKYRRSILSEIEYSDVMNPVRRLPLTVGAFNSSSLREQKGEEFIMDNTKGFVKGHIEQNTGDLGGMNNSTSNPVGASTSPFTTETNINISEYLKVLAENFKFPEEGLDFNATVDRFENILILAALARTGWNRNRAAGLLRLNRTTLVEKLKKKGLTPPPKEPVTPVTTTGNTNTGVL